jgi:hypothetical protein
MFYRYGKYEEIVFIQGEEAEEPMEILDSQGLEAVLKYLQQWDYGESPVVEMDYLLNVGNSDIIEEINGYLISYQRGIPYIGLTKIVDEDYYKTDKDYLDGQKMYEDTCKEYGETEGRSICKSHLIIERYCTQKKSKLLFLNGLNNAVYGKEIV